jgi:WD repeat-containing protein 6
MILTAATDGKLVLWQCRLNSSLRSCSPEPVPLVMLSTHKIHQSAIKSLDLMRFKEHILVASGGDDNALGMSAFPISESIATTTPTFLVLRSAHAAAVTGLCLLRDPKMECLERSIKVVTSSNDQKIKVWDVSLGSGLGNGLLLGMRGIGDVFTPIADVGDVATLWTEKNWGKALVVGNGIEIRKVIVQGEEEFGLQ